MIPPVAVAAPPESPRGLGKGGKARFHPGIDTAFGVFPVAAAGAGFDAGQQFDAFVYGGDRPDVELARRDGFAHVAPQHQMLNVGGGNQHALFASQPGIAADIEKALDLFIGAADGLDLAVLVDRPGYREALTDGDFRKRRQQRVKLGA